MKEKAREAILDTVTDDSYGLWEIVWSLKEPLVEEDEEILRDVAREVLLDMLRDGLIEVTRAIGPGREEEALSTAAAEERLLEDKGWAVPAKGEESVRVVATKRGLDLYFGAD